MSVQSQFSPEEIKRLVAGEVISKTVEGNTTPATANKNEDKSELPVATEPPTSYTPRTSIAISKVDKVTGVHVRSNTGEIVSDANTKIPGPSPAAFDRYDLDRAQAEAEAQAQREARNELKKIASPEALLNQLNAQRRVIEKLQKEMASLKKEVKG